MEIRWNCWLTLEQTTNFKFGFSKFYKELKQSLSTTQLKKWLFKVFIL
jgi:hypothetical protein